MWIVRLYKNIDTNRILGAKVVDNNMQSADIPWNILKSMVRSNPTLFYNVELNENNRVRLKNLNPKHRIKYYKQIYNGDIVANQYCIITNATVGRLSFIADTDNSIVYGEDVTIGDIASQLGIADISELNMYNAYIDNCNNKLNVWVYNGKSYRKVQNVNIDNIKLDGFKDWEVNILDANQDGIIVDDIRHRDIIDKAKIPNGIKQLNHFSGNVKELEIPISVKLLGKGCFAYLKDLKKLRIGKGVQEIPPLCFRYSSINQIRFSGCEKVIGKGAFVNSKIKGLISTSAKEIQESAFKHTNITTLSMYNIKRIGYRAFYFCTKLKSIRFGDQLEIIDEEAFCYCDKIEEISLPKTTQIIGDKAFNSCNKLKIAHVPKEVKHIGHLAFPEKCKIDYY